MVYGLWQSAAGLQLQDYRQSIIANNLANVDTPGFKPDRISFRERLNASVAAGGAARHPTLNGLSGGLFETPVYTDFHSVDPVPSDNRLDVAVAGDGFLKVETAEGPRYTRDGRLTMDRDGTLIHAASGGKVLDTQGRSISLNPTAMQKLKIGSDGRVTQGEDFAGQISLVDFADRGQLQKDGKNLFTAKQARPVEASGEIRQFAYEGSGVEPVAALAEMIESSRTYDLNARMISLQDETLGRAVSELGKIA